MNTDVEELLTDQMHKQAAAAAWRPELLHDALRRTKTRRTRRRALIPALAVSTAAAVAVSVALTAPSRSAPKAAVPRAQTAAYVVSRARSAVAAAGADVLEVRSHAGDGWSFTAWFDKTAVRLDVQPASGGPTFYFAEPNRTVIVDYQNSSWWTWNLSKVLNRMPARLKAHLRQPIRLLPAVIALVMNTWGGPGPGLPTAAEIRSELAGGSFRMVAEQTVNGQRLLELRGSDWRIPDLPPASGNHSLEMWISATSYLPVRSIAGEGVGAHSPPLVSEFSWLQATPANLAVLTPRIPSGFRHQAPQCPCG
jgi:hypothetical protein